MPRHAHDVPHPQDTPPGLVFGGETPRPRWRSMLRGWRGTCPACGRGAMFTRYLKVAPRCRHCGENLHHQRADDAPPYFTVFIVGHLLIPMAGLVEKAWSPAMWIHMTAWPLAALALSLLLLPRIKGGLVGLQWALMMHGFDPAERDAPAPESP